MTPFPLQQLAPVPDSGTLPAVYSQRVLPPEEWPRLAGTALEALWPHLAPEHTRIVVVEADGAIVACWAATRFVHLEGAWIAAGHQRAARRLLTSTRAQVRALGASYAVTGATGPDVAAVIARLGGQPLDVGWFMVPMGGTDAAAIRDGQ